LRTKFQYVHRPIKFYLHTTYIQPYRFVRGEHTMGIHIRTIIVFLIILGFSAVLTTAEIPPLIFQNGHQSVVADFSATTTSGDAPLAISFADTSSGFPDEWQWDFGDGTTSSEQNSLHIYREPGLYTVSLSIAGKSGSDKKTRLGYIRVTSKPVQTISEKKIQPLIPDLPQTGITTFVSTVPTSEPEIIPSTEISPSPTITPEIIYSPENNANPESESPITSKIQEFTHLPQSELLELFNPPQIKADFTPSITSGRAPLQVFFTDSSTGIISGWNWDFGDGETSNLASPEHLYQAPGIYSVNLTIHSDSSSDIITKENLIEIFAETTAAFDARPKSGSAPLTVAFIDDSNGPISSRTWSFGDGTTSDEINPTHVYSHPGVYDVSLTVLGPYGTDEAVNPAFITVTDKAQPIIAKINADKTSGTAPLTVRFSDVSSGDVTTRTWNFGEGNTASDQSIVHTFTKAGLYSVSLIIKGPSGESTSDIMISVDEAQAPPKALFSCDVLNGHAPLMVTFSDTSRGEVSSRYWEFGDGETSEEINPTHIFNNPGTFNVALTVLGPTGESRYESAITALQPLIPGVSFTSDIGEGPTPLLVSFTDTSTGNITGRIWDFGDGEISTEINPVHMYDVPGTYTVVLTGKGPGGSDRAETLITVTQPVQPILASFTSDLNEGPAPLTVSFTDTSTGEIQAWNWDFGDGLTSSEQNPIHTYQNPGTYTAVLTATGPVGEARDEKQITVTQPSQPILVSFTSDLNEGPAPLTVSFTDTSTGEIKTWNWDFGNGETSSEQNPVHTYQNPGTYTIVLTAAGPAGEARDEKQVTVTQTIEPVFSSFISNLNEGPAPLTVSFTDTSTGEIKTWNWDFGDGLTSSEQNPIHIYQNPGTYTTVLTTYGPAGESSDEKQVTVTQPSQPVFASFISNLKEGPAPLTVSFTDTSTGEIQAWNWDFGDGLTSSEQNPIHTYQNPGTYTAVLTATGPVGEARDEKQITVTQPSQPILVSFTSDLNEGPAPLTLSFTDISTGEIQAWNWDFGDGLTSSEQNPIHTYQNPGTYTAVLTATGPVGEARDEKQITVTQPSQPILASFTSDLNEGPAPLTVSFTDTSTGEIQKWEWEFGDGETSSEQNPVHTYQNPETYTPILTATGSSGQDGFDTTIEVTAPEIPATMYPPSASFRVYPDEGPEPLVVSFTDTSSDEIEGWFWDFGDGETSSEQNPTHTYLKAGSYTPVLIVTGPGGQDRTEQQIEVIGLPEAGIPLEPSFTVNPDEGETPLIVSFTDTSSGEIIERTWNFGDGEVSNQQNPIHTYQSSGVYTVTLQVRSYSDEATAESSINVTESVKQVVTTAPLQLKADFTTYYTEGPAPFTLPFIDLSKGEITEWVWDFGDGTVSYDQNPRHTYTIPGTYAVFLTVKGPSGEKIRSDATIILVSQSVGQPWAEFSIDTNEGIVPLIVSFTDSSTGEISEYNWDFGDGTSGAGKEVTHTYIKPGTFTAALTVKGPGGESRSDKTIVTTLSADAPQAAFTTSSTSGKAPFSVIFTDASIGEITGWSWNLGDGTTGEGLVQNHTYTAPGSYIAILSVTGPGGQGFAQREIIVEESKPKPVVNFSADRTEGSIPFRVHLTPTTIGQVDGYLWDLGDGTVSYDKELYHTYQESGNYSVRLTISGPGGVSTVEKTGFITATDNPVVPRAKIEADAKEGPVPLTVTFSGTADEPVDRYEWTFGDGTESSKQNPIHTYEKAGLYNLSLTVSGPGGSDTAIMPGFITAIKPKILIHASLYADIQKGMVPLTVTFTPTITGEVTQYLWDFGDNSTSSELTPVHTYQQAGFYPVSLHIAGPEGNYTAFLNEMIEVSNKTTPPGATIIAEITNGTAPLHTAFRVETNGTIDGYIWDFGDNTTSYDHNPVHVYAKGGTYQVKLVVSGPEGVSVSELAEKIIVQEGIGLPIAGFSGEPLSGYAPLSVTFSDLSNGTVDELWYDFGDGITSKEQNPDHTYESAGNYTVSERVSNEAGSSEEIKTDYITVLERPPAPISRFNADKRTGKSPLLVHFEEMASGEVTGWEWDLGDGNTSFEQNPEYLYTKPGVYSVSLTVTGPGGFDMAIRRGYIVVSGPASPPSAAIYAQPQAGAAPLTVKFLDISTGQITGWKWDLGDGTTSTHKNPTHIYQKPGIYTVRLEVEGSSGVSVNESVIEVMPPEKLFSSQENIQFFSSNITNETGSPIQKEESSEPVSITNAAQTQRPLADFIIETRNGTTPLNVSFKDTSSGKITKWLWSFGDGGVSEENNPTYTYQMPGIYPVSLTVYGPEGTSSKRVREGVEVF